MTPEAWARVDAVFDAALDLPDAERAAYVAQACGSDAEFRAAVERLLAAAGAQGGVLPDDPASGAGVAFAAPLVTRPNSAMDAGPVGVTHVAPVGAVAGGSLAPVRIGPYRILRTAGEGGMGTVYVAERADGEFRKTVALKIVRAGLHLDAAFVQRFRDERQILARLDHPNVARLLDGGVTEDGRPYFVMEYVDGERIDRWCDDRRLPIEQRLTLAAKVCDAVAAAHARQIVHRDIKPSNVLVTAEGEPKLVDFGIAKLLDTGTHTGEYAAMAAALTRTGQRLLTPEYASPEQVRGEPVTPASDVYALGVLLFELLTGERPLGRGARGRHAMERAILDEAPTRPSSVVSRRPASEVTTAGVDTDPGAGRRRTERAERIEAAAGARGTTARQLCRRLRGDLDAIVLVALRKEPERRYAGGAALAADLRRHLAGAAVEARGDGAGYRARTLLRRWRIAGAAAAVGMAAGAAALTTVRQGRLGVAGGEVAAAGGAVRLVPGAARRLAFDAGLELDPALSPDGSQVAYAAERADGVLRLFVRPVSGGRATALAAEVPGYHRAPRWSPDGRTVGFQAGAQLYAVPAAGGPARVLVAASSYHAARSLAWAPDGRTIAYVQTRSVYVRPTAGGPARRLTDTPAAPHSLAWSPDGRWLALVDGNSEFVFGTNGPGNLINLGNSGPSSVWLVRADSAPTGGPPRAVRVTDGSALATSPVWLPDGRGLLFISAHEGDRDVYHVRLSDAGRPLAAPARVTAGIGAHTIAVARRAGGGYRLAYAVFRGTSNVWALPRLPDRAATEADARPVTEGTQNVESLAASPDGRWLAFDSDRDGGAHLYLVPLGGVASGGSPSGGPGGAGRRALPEPRPLTPALAAAGAGAGDDFMPAWSPDGREVAYYTFVAGGERRLMVARVDGGAPQPVVPAPANQRTPSWAPDGRALAFSSDATGHNELYVVARDAGGRWGAARRLTTDGGESPRWSPDGREVLFWYLNALWTIPAAGGPVRPLFRPDSVAPGVVGSAAWGADGRAVFFKWIAPDGRARVRAVPAAGGPARDVVRLDDPRRQSPRYEFALDARHVYLTLAERASDVWALELGAERP